LKDVVRISKPK
jgi:hypothetical protein